MLSLNMDWVKAYRLLYSHYGPQGWWPLLKHKQGRSSELECRYHSNDYSKPSRREQFEIALGSILTQNTTFTSVEKSLIQLYRLGGLTPRGLLSIPKEKIISAIVATRYPNRKAEYLITLAEFFIFLKKQIPERKELLSLRGIGEETADSILLYGFSRAEFVIDAYTVRILTSLDHPPKNYRSAKEMFENTLHPIFPEYVERVKIYQEYHALLVIHAKHFYSRKIGGKYGRDGAGNQCFLSSLA